MTDAGHPLRSELRELEKALPSIIAPTIVIHGQQDRLVPSANAEFVQKAFANAEVDLRGLPHGDHFIPWTHAGVVRQALYDLSEVGASAASAGDRGAL